MHLETIAIHDDAISAWTDVQRVAPGEVGEFVVRSPVTTSSYFRRRDDDLLSKIPVEAGVWHRMGDVGYVDDAGDLWFCGRKKHRVTTPLETFFPVMGEAIFNQHPEVARTAIVGVGPSGREVPVLFVELEGGELPRGERARRLTREVLRSPRDTRAGVTSEMSVSIDRFRSTLATTQRFDARSSKWKQSGARSGEGPRHGRRRLPRDCARSPTHRAR
ncbi:MAG: AMP-binding protein [Myxococcales bacterium]|nr:AMP-binding protein [Myxococcales bacterium]